MFKYFLEAFFKPIDIVVNQVLLVDLSLVDETHECQTFIDLTKVKHDVLLRVGMIQSNYRA